MRNYEVYIPPESLLVVSIGAGILPHHPIGGRDLYFSYDLCLAYAILSKSHMQIVQFDESSEMEKNL
jgi:hypothetical protein